MKTKNQNDTPEVPVVHKRMRTLSPALVMERNFKQLPLSPRFEKLIGIPTPNFNSIIYGKAKSGKSSFALQLAEELAPVGKVLYVSSEELISKTLQDRIKMNNITHERIRFIGVRDVEQIERLITRAHPRFIFIDSVQICGMTFREFERMKNKVFKNRKSWHLISQTTNAGKMILSQSWVHETDIKIEVNNGIAISEGRFRADGHLHVFEKAKKRDLFSEAGKEEVHA